MAPVEGKLANRIAEDQNSTPADYLSNLQSYIGAQFLVVLHFNRVILRLTKINYSED